MHSRAGSTPFRRARKTSRYGLVAALAALSLVAPAAPVFAAPSPSPADPGPTSRWGEKTDFEVPPVKVGTTRPVPGEAEAEPTEEQAAWRAEQEERARTGENPKGASRSAAAGAAPTVYVPEDQGAVPWHQISDFRITDALVARINLSTGNLMLAATDFEIAGVGRTLRLARTYNSFDAPWGKVSQRWWQEYERYLQLFSGEVVLHDSTGATVRFTENAGGTFTTPKGYSKDLKRNADGTYTLTDRKSGSKDTYDEHGTLTEVTDKNHGTLTIDQHDEGAEHKGFKLTETRSGRWIDLVRTDASQWQAKDHTGRTAVFDLNAAGDLAKTTDTEGKSTVFAYDSSRRLTKITTPEGRVTVFTYDAENRVRSMLRATEFDAAAGHTGPTYTYAYSNTDPSAAGTTTVTDPEQHATKYEHNADGGVTKVTDALGHHRKRTFDANHNIDSAEDAMGVGGGAGNVTTYGWDARNNPTSAELPTGATATLTGYQTIAGADLPKTLTSADGEKTDYTYDTAGNTRSVAVTGTGGGRRTFDRNPATPTCDGFEGQVCKVTTTLSDTRSVSTSFDYDAKGNLSKVDLPAPLGDTTYTYDALGRPETATDGRGVKTVYGYDHRDRIVLVSSAGTTVRYHYDGDGNLRQRDDGTGVTKYAFDPLSRETVRTLQNGSQTKLTYTPAGNVDTYQDPAGVTDYTWNEVNKLTGLKDPTGRTTTYKYDANDFRTTTTYPGGTVQTVTPDKSGRPEKIRATSPKGTLVDLAYSYSNAGTDGTKIRTRTDAVTGLKTTYTYDGAGRFSYAKEEKGTTLTSSWQYCYDQAGNLTSQGVDPGCPRGTTYTVNDAQQITAKNGSTANWSYDKAGNETAGASTPEGTRTGEEWSDHSQMTSITVAGKTYAGQYGSTDQGERIKLGDTFFHNGPLGLSAKTAAGVDMGFNREPGGTLNSMTTGGSSYYYLTDALGSVVALADGSGTKVNTYDYSPRGVQRATTTEKVPQPYRFAGGYQDPTGLYHYAARYYDPHLGRFTQPDPSGQEKNPYLYAEGDPVNRIDPSGLLSLDISGEVCYYLCVGGGREKDDSGNSAWSVTFGVGSPGASASLGGSSGDVGQGWTGEWSCGVGTVSVTGNTQGDAGFETGGSTGKCSMNAKYTF
ncbi:RHS repeat-associated core domain-containing protein [Streptomyces prasinopilosus]|uniref:RHS repeat-associated core domain-containing protein n=1 Tax=Streptomyces prasinopilosus TaxID=67344 RepID=A0A1G6NCJ2_9ACTN|nr:RHS repeat-associated core domain-containing protein [Streptomyces prasinopilosus]SDC65599.1 RHS repeat-associated core domain-containing protein [Streptomyces prasinopilosus]